MGSRVVYALAFHADYRCRHSGKCCSADWDVPVELPIYASLQQAVASGALRSANTGHTSPFILGPDLPDDTAAILERDDEGKCVFYASAWKRCVVHRDLSEASLPATCRYFPRVAVQDSRGTFLSLSHFCPTAASTLFRDEPVQIVAGPAAFPPADYEGLVVTADDLPPMLTPRILMDLDGYTAWEQHMVARFGDVARRPESVLATLWRDAQLLAGWKPGTRSLRDAIEQLPGEYVERDTEGDLGSSLQRYTEVVSAVPDDLTPEPNEQQLDESMRTFVVAQWPRFHAPINRYLAAKAFASWTAYQGRGVRTIVRGLEAALALVRVEAARQCRDTRRALDADLLKEAIRASDYLLNHLAVGEDLAMAWSIAESDKRSDP